MKKLMLQLKLDTARILAYYPLPPMIIIIKKCKELLWNAWKEKYEDDVMNYGKGIYFYSNKPVPEYWPWSSHKSRIIETALAKLRIGHAGVNSHLIKINKSDTNMCNCGAIETIDHFLPLPLYIDK